MDRMDRERMKDYEQKKNRNKLRNAKTEIK
jgi:hypothetical protein